MLRSRGSQSSAASLRITAPPVFFLLRSLCPPPSLTASVELAPTANWKRPAARQGSAHWTRHEQAHGALSGRGTMPQRPRRLASGVFALSVIAVSTSFADDYDVDVYGSVRCQDQASGAEEWYPMPGA